jgi:cell division protein FtsL
MIRALNFFFLALAGLSCLALYHVSEQTRVAHGHLVRVQHEIAQERNMTSVLQAEWQRVADPARIQRLAQSELGLSDTATAQLASLELLPRRGENVLPGNARVRDASVTAPIAPRDPRVRLAAIHTRP